MPGFDLRVPVPVGSAALSVRARKRQAEYDAVSSRNQAIQHEVDALQTDAGIEDRARQEFGWSYVGEYAVKVSGLGVNTSESSFEANIVSGSVKAPETWYSRILDPLFGVK